MDYRDEFQLRFNCKVRTRAKGASWWDSVNDLTDRLTKSVVRCFEIAKI